MSLNTRGVLDPRFAYFARPVARGAMWGTITVARPKVADEWDPFDPDTPKFDDGFTYTKLYVGPARVQPNNDWRARKYRNAGELVTEHAMRFQLDLTGNTITSPKPLPGPVDDENDPIPLPGDAGMLRAGDMVKVDSVAAPYGFPVDSIDTGFVYQVRIVNASSNSWTRILLCDFIGQHVVES